MQSQQILQQFKSHSEAMAGTKVALYLTFGWLVWEMLQTTWRRWSVFKVNMEMISSLSSKVKLFSELQSWPETRFNPVCWRKQSLHKHDATGSLAMTLAERLNTSKIQLRATINTSVVIEKMYFHGFKHNTQPDTVKLALAAKPSLRAVAVRHGGSSSAFS